MFKRFFKQYKYLLMLGMLLILPVNQSFALSKHAETPVINRPEDSPFGVHGPYVINTSAYSETDITNFLADIGIKWVRIIAPQLEDVVAGLSKKNIKLYVGLSPRNSDREIRSIVSKYKDTVLYWRAGNEPDSLRNYGKEPRKYVDFLKRVYRIIKSESPTAVVTIGGLGNGRRLNERSPGPRFLSAVLAAGGGDYFDIFAFHFQGEARDYPDLKNTVSTYKKLLKSYGYEKPFWITEMATYDGDPVKAGRWPDPPKQTEAQQASGLLKRYVYGLRLGVKKLFWSLIVERHSFGGRRGNGYFSNIGLVHNPENDGKSHKKLAYYTYKKLIEILTGADWDNIQTILEKDGLYVYKFIRAGKPIWVAWNDNKRVREIKLAGIAAKKVKLTYAVADRKSGKEVTDYAYAFKTESLSVNKHQVALELGDIPVFIEEN